MIEKYDYIEIEFVLYDDSGKVVDTNIKEVGEKEGIKNREFKPTPLIVGEGFVVSGLDEAFVNKKEGEEFEIELDPKKAFGERDPSKIMFVPMKYFKSKGINPIPGLAIDVDGVLGIVKSVSGGRVLVDFNHPLAGKKVKYKVKICKVVKDWKEKTINIIRNLYNIDENSADVEISDDKIVRINLKKEYPLSAIKILAEYLKKWCNLKEVYVTYKF